MRKITQIGQDTGEALGGFVHDQMRVLMVLLADLNYENYIQVAQMDIAYALKMQKTNVSRAIKNLIYFGVILEGPKNGCNKNYRVKIHN
ncbi:hypothetical protein BN1086_04933 [Citrobacter koseri]|uniref:Uncharacterized protein n=1 Tax=Citrobacter koseri TaxID=545 RepID=A0A078LNG6_CITKO|nr:hypothetical protein BN1086_04933 [Citrobacter koseri]